jgi:hypothetical protein
MTASEDDERVDQIVADALAVAGAPRAAAAGQAVAYGSGGGGGPPLSCRPR